MPIIVQHGGDGWGEALLGGLAAAAGVGKGKRDLEREAEEYAIETEKAGYELSKIRLENARLEREDADRQVLLENERNATLQRLGGTPGSPGVPAPAAPVVPEPLGPGVSGPPAPPATTARPPGVYGDMSTLPSLTGGQVGVDIESAWTPADELVLPRLKTMKGLDKFRADLSERQDRLILQHDRKVLTKRAEGLKRFVKDSNDNEELEEEINGWMQQIAGAGTREELAGLVSEHLKRAGEIRNKVGNEVLLDEWEAWYLKERAFLFSDANEKMDTDQRDYYLKILEQSNQAVLFQDADPLDHMQGLSETERKGMQAQLAEQDQKYTALMAQHQQLVQGAARVAAAVDAATAATATPGAAWADVSSEDQESVVSQATESVRTAIASADGPVDPDLLVAAGVDAAFAGLGIHQPTDEQQDAATEAVTASLLETPSNKEVNKRVKVVEEVLTRAAETWESKAGIEETKESWGKVWDDIAYVLQGDTPIAKKGPLHIFFRWFDRLPSRYANRASALLDTLLMSPKAITAIPRSVNELGMDLLADIKAGRKTAREAAKEAAEQYKALPREEVRDWARGLGLTETQEEPAEVQPRGAEDLPPAEVEPQGRGTQVQAEEEMRAERLAFARWERRRPPRKAEDRPPAEAEEQGRGEQVQAEEEMRSQAFMSKVDLASRRAEEAGYPAKVAAKAEEANYDYESAKAAGLKPDAEGHWPSRVPNGPNEGLILKDVSHPTFKKTVEEDLKRGYRFYGKDGRIYSFRKKPSDEFQLLHDFRDIAEFVRQNDPSGLPGGPSPQREPRGGGIE